MPRAGCRMPNAEAAPNQCGAPSGCHVVTITRGSSGDTAPPNSRTEVPPPSRERGHVSGELRRDVAERIHVPRGDGHAGDRRRQADRSDRVAVVITNRHGEASAVRCKHRDLLGVPADRIRLRDRRDVLGHGRHFPARSTRRGVNRPLDEPQVARRRTGWVFQERDAMRGIRHRAPHHQRRAG